MVLDPHALEELGEQSDEDSYQGADIYGIGSSVKAVVLLDNGNIQGLVVPDAYEIGYKKCRGNGTKAGTQILQAKRL
mgnify:CR=1 FL=1